MSSMCKSRIQAAAEDLVRPLRLKSRFRSVFALLGTLVALSFLANAQQATIVGTLPIRPVLRCPMSTLRSPAPNPG